jgi:hypothetical protein
MTTNVNKYEPTSAEGKILDVMLNPENKNLNVTEICEAAGVSRTIYYRVFKNQEFVDYYREQSKNLVSQALGQVINACVNQAKEGSHPHIKTILEMADMHLDKIGVVGADGKPFQVNVNFVKPE